MSLVVSSPLARRVGANLNLNLDGSIVTSTEVLACIGDVDRVIRESIGNAHAPTNLSASLRSFAGWSSMVRVAWDQIGIGGTADRDPTLPTFTQHDLCALYDLREGIIARQSIGNDAIRSLRAALATLERPHSGRAHFVEAFGSAPDRSSRRPSDTRHHWNEQSARELAKVLNACERIGLLGTDAFRYGSNAIRLEEARDHDMACIRAALDTFGIPSRGGIIGLRLFEARRTIAGVLRPVSPSDRVPARHRTREDWHDMLEAFDADHRSHVASVERAIEAGVKAVAFGVYMIAPLRVWLDKVLDGFDPSTVPAPARTRKGKRAKRVAEVPATAPIRRSREEELAALVADQATEGDEVAPEVTPEPEEEPDAEA